MGGIIGDIGGALSSGIGKLGGLGTVIPGALTGFGLINNYLQQRRYNQIQDIARDPRKAARYFQGLERPLAAGAVAGAENQAQAALGERGLSQSPAIAAEVYSQALAPLYQAQQDAAMQAGGNLLGSALSVPPSQTDVSGPLAQLMQRLQKPTSSIPTPSTADVNAQLPPFTTPDMGGFGVSPSNVDISGMIPDPTYGIGTAGIQAPDWSTILGGVSAMPTDLSSLLSVPGGFGGPS